eukprot:Clim_evm9s195 gene=Clim_evmTU9s195
MGPMEQDDSPWPRGSRRPLKELGSNEKSMDIFGSGEGRRRGQRRARKVVSYKEDMDAPDMSNASDVDFRSSESLPVTKDRAYSSDSDSDSLESQSDTEFDPDSDDSDFNTKRSGKALVVAKKKPSSKSSAKSISTAVSGDIPLPTLREFERLVCWRPALRPGEDKEDPNGVDPYAHAKATNWTKALFLVKFKNRAYRDCVWYTGTECQKQFDVRTSTLTMHFNKTANRKDKEPFYDPRWDHIERVVARRRGNDDTAFYLVKWDDLPYKACTWEAEPGIGFENIEEFSNRTKHKVPIAIKRNARIVGQNVRVKPRKDEVDNQLVDPESLLALRPHQQEGVLWMANCWAKGRGCILADEMGLGKTIQALMFLQWMQKFAHRRGPFLIVVPLSVILNWQREAKLWTTFDCVVVQGDAQDRRIIERYEIWDKHKQTMKPELVLVTYETVMRELSFFRNVEWEVIIVDEAHRLKSRTSKTFTDLSTLRSSHRVLLTGTPLQNDTAELHTLLDFMEPGRHLSAEVFDENYGNVQDVGQVEALKKLLMPILLRRMKEDVVQELAVKEEVIIEVEMGVLQRRIYRALFERDTAILSSNEKGLRGPRLTNLHMELRKVCNHPYLITDMETRILDQERERRLAEGVEPYNPDPHDMLTKVSGKMVLLGKLLPQLIKDGHKVLIFSQMARVLDILEDFLLGEEVGYVRLDGSVTGKQRQTAIDTFTNDEKSEIPVFLLCTKAGGVGINLVAADTVVIYDSDWNPQNDIQAMARCHRIGQTKSVKVFRLLVKNSYERKMFDVASKKLGLDRAILTDGVKGSADAIDNKPSAQELERLLREGAYAALEDESGEAAKFADEDINTILARRTVTINTAEDEEERRKAVAGGMFSKISFGADAENDDAFVELEGEDFWNQWATKAKRKVKDEKALALLTGESASIGTDASDATSRRRRKLASSTNTEAIQEIDDEEDDDEKEDDGDFRDPKRPKRLATEWTKKQVKSMLESIKRYQGCELEKQCQLIQHPELTPALLAPLTKALIHQWRDKCGPDSDKPDLKAAWEGIYNQIGDVKVEDEPTYLMMKDGLRRAYEALESSWQATMQFRSMLLAVSDDLKFRESLAADEDLRLRVANCFSGRAKGIPEDWVAHDNHVLIDLTLKYGMNNFDDLLSDDKAAPLCAKVSRAWHASKLQDDTAPRKEPPKPRKQSGKSKKTEMQPHDFKRILRKQVKELADHTDMLASDVRRTAATKERIVLRTETIVREQPLDCTLECIIMHQYDDEDDKPYETQEFGPMTDADMPQTADVLQAFKQIMLKDDGQRAAAITLVMEGLINYGWPGALSGLVSHSAQRKNFVRACDFNAKIKNHQIVDRFMMETPETFSHFVLAMVLAFALQKLGKQYLIDLEDQGTPTAWVEPAFNTAVRSPDLRRWALWKLAGGMVAKMSLTESNVKKALCAIHSMDELRRIAIKGPYKCLVQKYSNNIAEESKEEGSVELYEMCSWTKTMPAKGLPVWYTPGLHDMLLLTTSIYVPFTSLHRHPLSFFANTDDDMVTGFVGRKETRHRLRTIAPLVNMRLNQQKTN